MSECLTRFWYWRSPLTALAAPLALVSYAFYWARRTAYRIGLGRRTRLPVPVVIIGNITLGGTGKTPLVLWLAEALRIAGRAPGIVCSAYRAKASAPTAVAASSDPRTHGDEAVLLARLQTSPVWSGANRAATARALAAAHPEIDVVICDDGLQHYRLARDCEIAVVDAMRGYGNGMLLPVGPLREPPSRLRSVDAVVVNGEGATLDLVEHSARFVMRLQGETFYNLKEPQRTARVDAFAGRRVAALAGIGNPQRFFAHLRSMGASFAAVAFPDHHPYSESELQAIDAEIILMTQKDAIKCVPFADARIWVLPVTAQVSGALLDLILTRITGLRSHAATFAGQSRSN